MLADGQLLIGKDNEFSKGISKVINEYGIDSELGMKDQDIADYIFEHLRTLKHLIDAPENRGKGGDLNV